MSPTYFGSFSEYEQMLNSWKPYHYGDAPSEPLPDPVPSEAEVLFASYGGEHYEGEAFVIFQKDGKLYEVNGSHCSCYGLENQWQPEETSVGALAMRVKKTDKEARCYFLSSHEETAYDAYWALIEKLQKVGA